MPITWEQETDELIVAFVSGKLAQPEIREFQAAVAQTIKDQGNIRFLAILNNFEGWEAGESWKDMSFMDANDQYVTRIAIVGDEEWRDQMLMFMLAGLRPIDILYFSPDQEQAARQWLTEE